MNIACSSWSFHRVMPQSLDMLSFPAWCGSHAIPSVEVVVEQFPALEDDYLQQFVRACDHAGVTVACLSASNDFTIPDGDRLFEQVERVRFLINHVAPLLRAPMVRVFTGTADHSPAGETRALEAFRGLRPDLEATGVVMVLENHSQDPDIADRTANIVSGMNSPLFGSCLDLGNLPPARRYESITTLAPYAKYVHAKSYAFDRAGRETTIDYRQALAILTEHGYDGTFSIEYEGEGDPYAGVQQTRDLVVTLWNNPAGQAAA